MNTPLTDKQALASQDHNRQDSHHDHDCGCAHHGSTIVNKTAKIGRNEPCPCGSGKKYKKCCI